MNFNRLLILCFLPLFSFAQSDDSPFQLLVAKADSAYKVGNYDLCCNTYEKAFSVEDQHFFSLYRAAKCFALNNMPDQSLQYLHKAIEINWKYTCQWAEKDETLRSLSKEARWKELKNKCKTLKAALNTRLQYELLSMQKTDQKWRSSIPAPNDLTYQAHLIKLQDIDEANTLRMKEIIDEYGWPPFSLVGEVGAHAAWILVQHADLDPKFQEKCLLLLEAAYKKGEASGNNYAYLYDRVMVNKGEKQLFGTQFYTHSDNQSLTFYPIEKEASLNDRRKEYQLNWSAEEYAKVMGFSYESVEEDLMKDRMDQEQNTYTTMITSGDKLSAQGDVKGAAKSYIRAMQMTGYIQTEDLIKGASILAKAKNIQEDLVFAWLKMAVIRGWTDIEALRKEKDFRRLKSDSRWKLLHKIVEE